ncbi:nodulation efficiency protein NfeD [Bordetella bronchiseptica 7E71]|nr:nodulation protein NfeD [Bordetella bronchiseptica]KCV50761.1 nodulation efficiency protein NfeD [Bordetella bronchiseptica 7E71]
MHARVPRLVADLLHLLRLLGCLAALLLPAAWDGARAADSAAAAPRTAVVLSLDGIVGPASADYIVRGLAGAAAQHALVVLRIDTPGGLDASMREIIRAILASPVPVLAYVAPGGARAASAGTYILYASHVAAMAPATNLGAATPVSLGGGFTPPDDKAEPDKTGAKAPADGGKPATPRNAAEYKAINDAVAYIRALADLRGRNADWAEQAVREAASLSASEALARNVIDIVAEDTPALLAQADGRTVRVGAADVVLHTSGLALVERGPDWRTRLLGVITNPNLALILLMVGVYGLIFEFMSPGALFPGVLGAICLLLGLYALSVLPLSYAGAGLVALGAALMVAEIFTPSLGALGVGGALSFVLGATMLVDADTPAYAVSLPLVGGVAVASLGLTFLIARLALRSRRAPQVSGAQGLVGRRGRVLSWEHDQGYVAADGERWRARGPAGLAAGDAVTIHAVQGVTLHVAPEPPAPQAPSRP